MRFILHPSSFILCLFLAFQASVLAAPEEAQRYFEQANTAASKKQYDEAIEAYGKALSYGDTANLHFNLANAFREAGMNGSAVLHYERALLLNPTLLQARHNLGLLRTRQGLPEPSFNFLETFAGYLPALVWAILLAGFFWVAVATIVLPRFFGGKRTWVTLTLLASIMGCGASSVALLGWHFLENRAVVLDQSAPLRTAPAKDAMPSGNLSPGDHATIEGYHLDYLLVRSNRGQTGWVHASEITPLIAR